MSETHDVRRHRDGSIDMDFYRARAGALRRTHIAQVGRALRRHVLQLLAAFADVMRPDRRRQAVLQPAVARRGDRQYRN